MRIAPDTHLTYCLNIHPGESWREQRAAIATHAAAVKAAVAPRRPFGLGLRLGREAADTLAAPVQLADLRRLLRDLGMYVFTINGFPYGPFHGRPVKREVYRPDWRAPERLDYTVRLAELLAALLPAGMAGSISTLPLSYRGWLRTPAQRRLAVARLAACAAALHEIEKRTGREIHLGLEPEPDCELESTADVIRFFARELLPVGGAWLRRERGWDARASEAALRRHLGVCFDACHLSVQFEKLDDSVAALARHGIRLSKVQLSAALRAPMTAAAADRLKEFVDPVHLHQVKIRGPRGALRSFRDLTPALLARWRAAPARGECRVHFHVPLYAGGHGELGTTAGELTPAFFAAARAAGARDLHLRGAPAPLPAEEYRSQHRTRISQRARGNEGGGAVAREISNSLLQERP